MLRVRWKSMVSEELLFLHVMRRTCRRRCRRCVCWEKRHLLLWDHLEGCMSLIVRCRMVRWRSSKNSHRMVVQGWILWSDPWRRRASLAPIWAWSTEKLNYHHTVHIRGSSQESTIPQKSHPPAKTRWISTKRWSSRSIMTKSASPQLFPSNKNSSNTTSTCLSTKSA